MRSRSDLILSAIGATYLALWGGFAVFIDLAHGRYIPVLLVTQAALGAAFMIFRRPMAVRDGVTAEAPLAYRIFAWAASVSPAILRAPNENQITQGIALVGGLLTLWALISLGRSFGIAPADRGLVARGPYRFIRHPMYAGQLIPLVALTILNITWWNVAALLLILASVLIRIRWEERLLGGYSDYAGRVTWRLVPGLW